VLAVELEVEQVQQMANHQQQGQEQEPQKEDHQPREQELQEQKALPLVPLHQRLQPRAQDRLREEQLVVLLEPLKQLLQLHLAQVVEPELPPLKEWAHQDRQTVRQLRHLLRQRHHLHLHQHQKHLLEVEILS
jgi:hypothetical protein